MSHEHEDHCGCGSCDDEDMDDIKPDTDEVGKVIDLTPDGGIKKKILRVGTGWAKPPKESEVKVHYVGTLLDGSGFDSSRERGEPFVFKLGVGQVIKGWDTGVATMKKGELALLTCTAPYAYGDSGHPPKIPAGATLNFEVELLSWVDEKDISDEKDGSLMKKSLKDGEGWEQPTDDATVTVKYKATLRDAPHTVVDQAESATFTIGEEQAPTKALEKAVQNMKKGETAVVVAAPSKAYGAAGDAGKQVPPNAGLRYEITLLDMKKPRMAYEMDGPELLATAEAKRVEGNALYKEGKVARALRRYKKALELLGSDYKFNEEEKKKARAAKVPCHLNVAACSVANKEWKEAVEQCGKALEIEAGNVRALVRRGKAYVGLDDWDAAQRDFARALEIEPANADAVRENQLLAKKRAENDRKIKGRLQGMFGKMAKMEEEEEKRAKAEAELLEKQRKEEEEALKKKAEASKPADVTMADPPKSDS